MSKDFLVTKVMRVGGFGIVGEYQIATRRLVGSAKNSARALGFRIVVVSKYLVRR